MSKTTSIPYQELTSQTPRLLEQAPKNAVRGEPFPYLVVNDALDIEYYRELEAQLPNLQLLREDHRNCNNRRVDLVSSSGRAELDIDKVASLWREFLAYHASDEFVSKVISLFEDHIPKCGSRLYQEIQRPRWIRSLYRPRDKNGGRLFPLTQPLSWLGVTDWLNDFRHPHNLDVRGRATLSLNTPVREQTSVRGPHVDSMHKCYVGLFYLRHPDDQSTGGDLELFRWKTGRQRTRWPGRISADDVEIIETVPYRPNTFVVFLNTSDAIHGVSVRSESEVPRYLVVTSGWFASAPARVVGAPLTGEGRGVYAE